MKGGRWKMEGGRWKVEDRRWKMEGGRWKMEDGRDHLRQRCRKRCRAKEGRLSLKGALGYNTKNHIL